MKKYWRVGMGWRGVCVAAAVMAVGCLLSSCGESKGGRVGGEKGSGKDSAMESNPPEYLDPPAELGAFFLKGVDVVKTLSWDQAQGKTVEKYSDGSFSEFLYDGKSISVADTSIHPESGHLYIHTVDYGKIRLVPAPGGNLSAPRFSIQLTAQQIEAFQGANGNETQAALAPIQSDTHEFTITATVKKFQGALESGSENICYAVGMKSIPEDYRAPDVLIVHEIESNGVSIPLSGHSLEENQYLQTERFGRFRIVFGGVYGPVGIFVTEEQKKQVEDFLNRPNSPGEEEKPVEEEWVRVPETLQFKIKAVNEKGFEVQMMAAQSKEEFMNNPSTVIVSGQARVTAGDTVIAEKAEVKDGLIDTDRFGIVKIEIYGMNDGRFFMKPSDLKRLEEFLKSSE